MAPFNKSPVPGWGFSLRLERLSLYLTMTVLYLAIFLYNWAVMVVTLGIPYLHYRLYKYNGEDSHEIQWLETIKSLNTSWDQYYYLPLNVLPFVFPMISSSGLSPCSMASFMATMTLVVGVVSVATSSIYKVNTKVLQNERVIAEWSKASQLAWREVPNKSFWVFMSLPIVAFFLSVGLFISTVMLAVWERAVVDTSPRLEIEGCSEKRLLAFKAISLAILVPIVSHFVFIFAKMRSVTILRTTEVVTAV